MTKSIAIRWGRPGWVLRLFGASLLAGAVAGCGAEGGAEHEPPLGTARAASSGPNGWNVNGWNVNGWNVNGWNVNGAPVPSALGPTELGRFGLWTPTGPAKLCQTVVGNKCTLTSAWVSWIQAGGQTRRDAMTYLGKCATPTGTQIEEPGIGVYGTRGFFALASQWMTGSATAASREWVTACMLAHANAWHGIQVSFRGPASNLGLGPTEATDFPAAEAAFYGDLFKDTPVMNVCGAYNDGIGGYLNLERDQRLCSSDPAACHMNFTGPCGMYPGQPTGSRQCSYFSGNVVSGYYASCGVNPTYTKVITTYLDQSDFEDLYDITPNLPGRGPISY